MTQSDYEQKKRECWHSVNNNTRDFGIITLRCFTAIFDCAYALGKEAKEAEGEEMLMCEKSKVQGYYQEALELIDRGERNNYLNDKLVGIDQKNVLYTLFGSKCPPGGNSSNVDEIGKDCNGESSEPKSAESKYIVGDKVMYKGVIRVIDSTDTTHRYHLSNGNYYAEWVNESDLEPYTEPDTSHETPVCENHSDNTSQKEVYVSSNRNLSQEPANYDKQFDTILKDGFSKERRLNIAAMMAQAMLTRVDDTPQVIADAAFRHADALIAESERRVK